MQEKLKRNAVVRGVRTTRRASLTGLMFDADGYRMSPTHVRNRHGRHYLYYVSAPLQSGGAVRDDLLSRVPALVIEDALLERLRRWSGRSEALLAELIPHVKRITLHRESLIVDLMPPAHENWASRTEPGEQFTIQTDCVLQIQSPAKLCTRGGGPGSPTGMLPRAGRGPTAP